MLAAILLTVACAAYEAPLPDASRSFPERFAVPPAESRILRIIHHLPDTPEQQDKLFTDMIFQGFGGLATNVSFNGYVESEPAWTSFLRAVDEAKKRGMCLWLYDERGYPSGNAGGITMRDHPDWAARGLLVARIDLECQGPVSLKLPPGKLFKAAAYPMRDNGIVLAEAVDLAGSVVNGAIEWDAPEDSWRVLAITENDLYEGTHAAVSLADKLPYINMLMPEPTARFLEVTHDAYAKRLGGDLGKYFEATFTDEPSLMSLYMRKQAYSPLPWSPNLAAEFQKRHGYALEPVLPLLMLDDDAGKSAKVRCDFWRTVGDLVSENFFGQIQDRCRKYNTQSGGHLLLEEGTLMHVPLYGNFYQCIRRLDAPSIDCLTSIPREVPWFVARILSSAGDLNGRASVMCEVSDHSQVYRPEGNTRPKYIVSEDEIRGTCNRLIANGITTLTSYYSFTDLGDEPLRRLNESLGRCSTALKGGRQVADLAVVYPAESLWPHFAPSTEWVKDAPPAAKYVEEMYRFALDQLFAAKRDMTILDAQAIIEAKLQDGCLENNGLSWRAVVLPGVDTLPIDAWRKLLAFWRSGGIVISVGTAPANSETDFPSAEVTAIRDEMFGRCAYSYNLSTKGGAALLLPRGQERMLTRALDAILDPDVKVSQDSSLHWTHRRIDGQEVWFVYNDSSEAWSGSISLAASGAGEQCDPATGSITPLTSAADLSLSLGAYGGMIYRFSKAEMPARKAVEDWAFVRRVTLLPETAPTLHPGENFEAAAAPSPDGSGVTVSGRVKRTDADCFVFSRYAFEKPQDFSRANALSMRVSIPDGNVASVPVLLIVADAAGMEYCIETPARLDSPGEYDCIVPLSHFRKAGWKEQAEGAIDWAQIQSMNIGWGGHKGVEDDKISFTAARPRVVW